MSKRLIVLLAAVLAIAVIPAGCGSGDSAESESVDEVTITKVQLIAQGDKICKQGSEEIKADLESYVERENIPKGQKPNDEQAVEIVETVIVPSLKTEAERIRGLGAPGGDEREIGALLDSLDEAVEEAERNPESLFEKGTDPFADSSKKASDYGFEVCGQS